MSELEESNLEVYGTINVPLVPKSHAQERVELLKSHLPQLMKENNNYSINQNLKYQKFWTIMGGL